MKTTKSIYDLELHEEIDIVNSIRTTRIIRVANGWNYIYFTNGKCLGMLNVPFDNKFQIHNGIRNNTFLEHAS